MTIEGMISGLLGSIGGGNAPANRPGNRDYLDVIQGDALYNTEAKVEALIGAAAHEDYRKIWENTVPAQQELAWGFGSAGLPRNQGFMWFASLDEGTDADVGFLRLAQSDANGYKPIIVGTFTDNMLHGSTLTTTETAHPSVEDMMPLPEKREHPTVGEDSKMQLWYALRTPATTHDAIAFDIPITRYIR